MAMGLERPAKFQEYDLLELREKKTETNDPEVEQYFKAKELFRKGFELASKIPNETTDEILRKHEGDIFESTKYLVEAFLVDEKATEMSPRIMALAQQYEKLLKLQYGGEDIERSKEYEKATTFEESLILVIWLLFNGKQFQFCIQTLSIALNQLEQSLHPRLLHLRASCYLATGDNKLCIKDLERLVALNPNFVDAYSIQGLIYMQQDDRVEAVRAFKSYIEKANKDSIGYANALYALSVLTIQNATATATSSRKQSLQNLRTQQAYNYYDKAKEAEKRFEYLYGHPPEMTDVKRTAMTLFEKTSRDSKNEKPKNSQLEAERLAPILQQLLSMQPQTSLAAANITGAGANDSGINEKKCHNCGSETRKDENGEIKEEKKNKLLICTGCTSTYYCSKECQKKDWKQGHKQQCGNSKQVLLKQGAQSG
ncbi:12890_t:CDS:2 [Ambispora gerdemannii]|uniref:12890_t:CDS:1 n=1 Tax=Ambispora gerdemannii TaxID=144530 RepID=A0A9N8V1I2_9GLOM|nr:12890_t:CDS:2 [Ambispora gerdemannii]